MFKSNRPKQYRRIYEELTVKNPILKNRNWKPPHKDAKVEKETVIVGTGA